MGDRSVTKRSQITPLIDDLEAPLDKTLRQGGHVRLRFTRPSRTKPAAHILAALAASALILGTGLTGPASASLDDDQPRRTTPVHFPAHPKGLPAQASWGHDIDPATTYQPQMGCAAKVSVGIARLRKLALATYDHGSDAGSIRACTDGSISEHKDGRAWDWALDVSNRADRRVAGDFLAWLTVPGPSGVAAEMAHRLGVMYVIYNRMMWSAYTGTWRTYTGSDPHTSHIHISLSWNGAHAHTSFWTGRVWRLDYGPCQIFAGQPAIAPTHKVRTRPCPAAVPVPRGSNEPLAWLGSIGPAVKRAQRLLSVPADGDFDKNTRRAVLAYQGAHELPRTGALDQPTWGSLLPAERTQNVPARTPAGAARWARTRAGSPTLMRGAAGKEVYALQTALRMPDSWRNGFFSIGTRDAVITAKKQLGLRPTGVVTPDLWAGLPLA
jgi:peptidoglycan hydrolase-like protein with peptidoglycan-binding domain